MIIFHEGLPGSGKSFGAMKDHIIPALVKGRKVFCYIEGLDHKKIAELADITDQRCHELLIQLTREDVPNIYDRVENDSLVVIDELQNFFPDRRQPLDEKITQFVTEHRHRGLDILGMGQLLKDCHKLWRNRTSQKVTFQQREALGKPNEYKWIVYKGRLDARGNVIFDEVTKGKAEYDPKYFGTYASHEPDTENKETFKDSRANIFNSPVLKKWLPTYGIVLVFAIGFLIYAFKGGGLNPSADKAELKQAKQETQQTKTGIIHTSASVAERQTQYQPQKADTYQVTEYKDGKSIGTRPEILPTGQIQPMVQNDYIDQLSSSYRIRLGGVMHGQRRTTGIVEWRDDTGSLKEQLSIHSLAGFGWLVLISPDGSVATLTKNEKRYIVTAWPLQDPAGKVNEVQQARIRGDSVSPGALAEPRIASISSPEPVKLSEPEPVVKGNTSTNPKYNVALRGQ